jgi:aminoglycoside 6-adenylyltransferase
MDMYERSYDLLIERFTVWAGQEENVRAAIIIGSQARSDHPADEWSDLDVIILARDPDTYWQTNEWLDAIGATWLDFVEPSPDGRSMEHRVLFAGGLDTDFALSPAAAFRKLLEGGLPSDIADTIQRGIRVLVDKDNLVGLLPELSNDVPAAQLPSKDTFLNLVHNFWYHTLWTAKHLRRGELWWAKSCCDIKLKILLQEMLEWHAQATRFQRADTWLRGRFLEEWADPRAVAALSGAFAHYEEADIWRALLATMDLFAWLERETAAVLGYQYPSAGAEHTADRVHELFAGRALPV